MSVQALSEHSLAVLQGTARTIRVLRFLVRGGATEQHDCKFLNMRLINIWSWPRKRAGHQIGRTLTDGWLTGSCSLPLTLLFRFIVICTMLVASLRPIQSGLWIYHNKFIPLYYALSWEGLLWLYVRLLAYAIGITPTTLEIFMALGMNVMRFKTIQPLYFLVPVIPA